MVRWLRRRDATQHFKRARIERVLEEIRKAMERELMERLKRWERRRLLRSYYEWREFKKEVRRFLKQVERYGYRHAVRNWIRNHLLTRLVDDEVLKFIEAKQYAKAVWLHILKTLEAETEVMDDEIFFDARKTLYRSLLITEDTMRITYAMLRYFALVRKVFSFIRNPSIRTLNSIAYTYEYFKEVLKLPPLSHLIYHDVCYADRDLVKFDFRLPSRIYVATSTLKITYNVVATFGLFVAMLALGGTFFQKPDGEFITNVAVANEQASDIHDRVAVARTDDNRYVVSYPLFFALYRPDRLEKWKAKQLGRRELYDVTVHCSIYRDPVWRRGKVMPRISTRVGKVRRLNVSLSIRWWTGS